MDQLKVGSFIAVLRHEAGLTQEALGQKLGVTNKTISRWENGCYLPDIELLQLLGGLFDVSINELLCGEKLADADFRKKADANLVSTLRESPFTLNERTAFWKKKWLRQHTVLLVFCFVALGGALALGWYYHSPLLAGACPLLGVVVYTLLRHRMMVYVEGKLYP